MAKTFIPVLIEASCNGHPLLPEAIKGQLPAWMDLFGDALAYGPTGIDVDADTEIMGNVSELVGIGVGLAAACKVFRVNPNRMSRFITKTTGQRIELRVHDPWPALLARGAWNDGARNSEEDD